MASSCAYQPVVPTTMRHPSGQHGAHVFDGGFGGGEVDDDVDAGERGRGKRSGVGVLVNVHGAHAVAALAGDFGHQRTGLSHSEDEEQHFS